MAVSKAWEEETEQIKLRVPKGTKDLLLKYVNEQAQKNKTSLKYSSYNEHTKQYKPSLNALIKYLLQKETGIDLIYNTTVSISNLDNM